MAVHESAHWGYPQAPTTGFYPEHPSQDADSTYSVNPALLMGGGGAGGTFNVGVEGSYPAESAHFFVADEPKSSQQPAYDAAYFDPAHEHREPASQEYSPPAFVPELSPSSSTFSSPTSTDTPYPSVLSSAPTLRLSGNLLPSLEILDDAHIPAGPATSMGFAYGASQGSRFAEMQDTYLREQAELQHSPVRPRYLSSPSAPGPHRHRSPAPSTYSPSPSPSSAYSHISSPVTSSFSPYERRERRGSIGSNGNGSPRSLNRRPSRLNLSIPQQSISPSVSAGYRMGSQMGTLPGGPDDPVAPATDEAMDQLLLEMGTILGPPIAALEAPYEHPFPSPQILPMPISLPRRESRAQGERHRPAPLLSLPRRTTYASSQAFEISGVPPITEKWAHDSHPRSAPAWQTSFRRPSPPMYEQYASHPQQYYQDRSHDSYPIQDRASYYSDEDSHSTSYLPAPAVATRPQTAPADDSSAPPYPSVMNGPPTHNFGSQPSSPLRYTTPAPTQQYQSSPPKPAKAPRAPRKRASSAKSAAPKAAMFINYGASDAKKLLNGVAPSGSSKRKREEEEAAARLKKEEAAARLAASCAPHSNVVIV